MKRLPYALFASLILLLGSWSSAYAVSTFITGQGGTGTTTPSGILYGDNGSTTHLNTVTIGSNLTFVGGTLSATGGAGGVSDVSNSDGTLTISPTTGSVVASLNLANANTWGATQGFGTITFNSGTASIISNGGGGLNITDPNALVLSGGSNVLTLNGSGITTNNGFTANGAVAFGGTVPGTLYLDSGRVLQSESGTSGNCVQWGASGTLTDAGSACGSGTGGVTSVSGTYPILSSGGATPAISIAFGTTTSNTWAGTQTFTNSPTFSTLGAGTVNSTAAGKIYNTATSTPSAGTGISYSGTFGDLIGGTSGTISATLGTNITPGELNNAASANSLIYTDSTAGLFKSVATSSMSSGTGISFTGTAGALVSGTALTVTNTGVISNSCPGGFLTCSGTNPSTFTLGTLGIVNGGTGTTTSGIQGQNWIVGPAGVFNATSTIFTSTASLVGIGTTTPGTLLSIGSTGTNAIANFTNSTSTIYQNLIVGSAQGSNPYFQVGGGSTPYGYLANDRVNILDTRNDYSAANIINTNAGACATADLTAANDLASNAAYFADLGHTSSGFTGVGCANNPFPDFGLNSSYLFDPTGNMTFLVSSTTNGQFQWDTGGAGASGINRKMTLTNAGRLGIGTTTPTSKVSITSTTTDATQSLLTLSQNGTPVFDVSTTTSTSVAIATTSPLGTNVLTTNGGVYMHGVATGAGNGAMCMTTDGQVLYDAGANCIVSSLRFKNVDATITPEESLSTVLKLSPIFFHYKEGYGDNGRQQQEGFGAEEVALVDTNLVQYDAHGDPFSVFYQNITAKLVGAVQAIWDRLNSQQREIDDLKAQVKALQDAQQHPIPKQI